RSTTRRADRCASGSSPRRQAGESRRRGPRSPSLPAGACRQHETVEERGKLAMARQRQDLRDILVRPHDDDAAILAVDATQIEDVMPIFAIGAENLFVVKQAVAAFGRPQERWQALLVERRRALLED